MVEEVVWSSWSLMDERLAAALHNNNKKMLSAICR